MDRLSHIGYQLIAIYMGFLVFAGGAIQLVTFLVLIRSKDLKAKSLTPYLINVVAANMVMVLGSFPSTMVSALVEDWAFDDLACRIVSFFGGIAAVAMIATMTCITVKIHSTVTSRGVAKRFQNENKAYHSWSILAVWLYAIISMIPPLAGWTRVIKESANLSCAPNWKAESTPDLVYVLILTMLAYVFPVTLASVYHWRINRAINNHLKTVSRFSSAQRQLEGFRNITKMAGLAITAFTITWLPYALYVVVSAFGGSYLIDTKTGVIACLVAKSSILYNPFIYALVNPRFRANVFEYLKVKQFKKTAVNILAHPTLQSISCTNTEFSGPNQPRIIFQNQPELRPRGGRENYLSEREFSFPSFFEEKKQPKSVEPRILVVRPVA